MEWRDLYKQKLAKYRERHGYLNVEIFLRTSYESYSHLGQYTMLVRSRPTRIRFLGFADRVATEISTPSKYGATEFSCLPML